MKIRILLTLATTLIAILSLPSTLVAQSIANRMGVANYPPKFPYAPAEAISPAKKNFALSWKNLKTGERGHTERMPELTAAALFNTWKGQFPYEYQLRRETFFLGIRIKSKVVEANKFMCDDGGEVHADGFCADATPPQKMDVRP